MARIYTPKDAHVLMNELVKQATGQQAIRVIDSSSFISAGELVIGTGMENVYNSLSCLVGRTWMAVRPYEAKITLFQAANTDLYTSRMRKISYYAKNALPSGWFNTDLYTNLKNGYTNGQNTAADPHSTKSMWEQDQNIMMEMFFGGSSTWQDCITRYENQVKTALRNEDEFIRLINGMLVEKYNDVASQKEAYNRMVLLNAMATRYLLTNKGAIANGAINLTAAFNAKFGTAYTSQQLRTTYLTDFLSFLVSTIKQYSNLLTHRSLNFHWSPAKNVDGTDYYLLRHTPKSKQKLMMYEPLFIEATAQVLPEIFNPKFLKIENYEGVDYWQALEGGLANNPAMNVIPAIPDTDSTSPTYGTQIQGDAVNIPYVVGFLFDDDAIMTDFQFEGAASTGLEARKGYRNTWLTFAKNGLNDATENAILFYMED